MIRKAGNRNRNKKQRAAWRGQVAERIAEFWLRLKGYRILGRNLRTPVGEIDLLARSGDTLVVCEVKHRPTLEQAMRAITPRQQQRLARAASYILARPNRGIADISGVRFDLIAIVNGRLPKHIRDAWRS